MVGDSLGRSREAPGGLRVRSQIHQKIDPKTDPKSDRIATEKNGSSNTPVVVSALDQPQQKLDAANLKKVSKPPLKRLVLIYVAISRYIYIYIHSVYIYIYIYI